MSIITLPKQNLKYLDDNIIEVDIPSNIIDKEKLNIILQETKGLWKDKNIDPSEYQKQIRNEWK